jgi:hypothetical protein
MAVQGPTNSANQSTLSKYTFKDEMRKKYDEGTALIEAEKAKCNEAISKVSDMVLNGIKSVLLQACHDHLPFGYAVNISTSNGNFCINDSNQISGGVGPSALKSLVDHIQKKIKECDLPVETYQPVWDDEYSDRVCIKCSTMFTTLEKYVTRADEK